MTENTSLPKELGSKYLFQDMCRCCLFVTSKKTEEESHFLFDSCYLDLYSRITCIKLNKPDYLPKVLCQTCASQMDSVKEFAEKCIRSEKRLNEIASELSKEPLVFIKEEEEAKKTDQCSILKEKIEKEINLLETNVINSEDQHQYESLNSEPITIKKTTKTCIKLKRLKTKKSFKINPESNFPNRKLQCYTCKKKIEAEMMSKHYKETECKPRELSACELCNQQCNFKFELEKHSLIHTNGVCKCTICPRVFKNKHSMKKHVANHSSAERLTCEFCGKGFKEMNELKLHVINVHQDQKSDMPSVCNVCSEQFPTELLLKLHFNKEHTLNLPETEETPKIKRIIKKKKLKDKKCDKCDETFFNQTELLNHKNLAHHERKFLCSICGRGSVSNADLLKHMVVHTGEKSFACDQCDAKFTRKASLKIHMFQHSGIKQFSCDLCDKKFTLMSYLKDHRRIHTAEKPFTCSLCPKTFRLFSGLKIHKRVHSGERPYACAHCKLSFKTPSQLSRHVLNIHSLDKPHECGFCGRKFAQAYYLKEHERAHTGEQPFPCQLCGKCFKRPGDRNKHVKRLHKELLNNPVI